MQTKIFLVAISLLLVIIGYQQYRFRTADQPITNHNQQIETEATTNQVTPSPVEAPISAEEVVAKLQQNQPVSVTCEFIYQDQLYATGYFKDQKIRIEGFETEQTETGTPQTGYSIITDGVVYAWQEGETSGYLFQTEPTTEQKSPENLLDYFGDEADSEVEGLEQNCVAKPLDDSLFIPPANIEFVDFNQNVKDVLNRAIDDAFDQAEQETGEQFDRPEDF